MKSPYPLTLCLLALCMAAPCNAERELFAMDTGTRDADHKTYAEQASLVKRLGYSGIGFSGCSKIAEMLEACKAEGIQLSTIYTGLKVEDEKIGQDDLLEEAIRQLRGSGTTVWIYVTGKRPENPDVADIPLVEKLRQLASLAEENGVRLSLYPHAGFYADRLGDCVRLASKVDNKHLGVTFNLCHWLKVEGPNGLGEKLKDALPHLSAVTINGADTDGKNWNTLIQTLDKGSFDVATLLGLLDELGYKGPIGLQQYGVGGTASAKLGRSMAGWKLLNARLASEKLHLIPPGGDLTAFRKVGDWVALSGIKPDPENPRSLTGTPKGDAVLNGTKGKTSHLVTKEEFGDIEAHIEFMISDKSNSGIYFMGRYEIQIYDSHGVEKDQYPGIECGGIYPRWIDGKTVEGHSPMTNASRPPGQWQTFDVVFRAPRFDAGGKKIENARFISVRHNGSLIHEDVELSGPTRAGLANDEKEEGPIMFQGDHGPVAFRNVWVKALSEPDDAAAKAKPGAKLIGTWEAVAEDDTAVLTFDDKGTINAKVNGEQGVGTYHVNQATEPHEIDIIWEKLGKVKTIFKFLGDDLLMENNHPGEPRPESFSDDAYRFKRLKQG